MSKSKSTRGPKPQSDQPQSSPQLSKLLEHIQEQQRRCQLLNSVLFAAHKEACAEDIDLIEVAQELASDIDDQLDSVVVARLVGVGAQS